METVPCNLCGAEDAALLNRERDLQYHIEGTFDLVRCCRCGLMYVNPRPTTEEMARFYPPDYRPHRARETRRFSFERLDERFGSDRRCRAVLARLPTKRGRVLDVGCSTGSFLEAMRRRGNWETYGVEINVEVAEYARSAVGLNVFPGSLQQAEYPDGFFDAVTLWNVLEHLHEPYQTLLEVARILKPGGLVAASIPNPDCIEAKVFGLYWAGWDAPRHLTIFARETIRQMLIQAGFEVRNFASFTGRYQMTVFSLGAWLDDRSSGEVWRRGMKRMIGSVPVRLLALPYFCIADRLNQSSIITVFATRR
jgi:2-polyprenyl-3-methyl-5-hydroxy-6-metoxy-1,4-benzoquinol methylase